MHPNSTQTLVFLRRKLFFSFPFENLVAKFLRSCCRWHGSRPPAGASRLGHAQCGEPLHRGEQGRLWNTGHYYHSQIETRIPCFHYFFLVPQELFALRSSAHWRECSCPFIIISKKALLLFWKEPRTEYFGDPPPHSFPPQNTLDACNGHTNSIIAPWNVKSTI